MPPTHIAYLQHVIEEDGQAERAGLACIANLFSLKYTFLAGLIRVIFKTVGSFECFIFE